MNELAVRLKHNENPKIKYMEQQKLTKIKIIITSIVTIVIFAFLFKEHLNGGVISHHILGKRDLPSISNWWGGLLMPILTWFLLGRIEKRLEKQSLQGQLTEHFIRKVFGLFLTGLIFGILLSTSFVNQYKLFLDNVLYILILLSFLIPIYYSEFILGFILGMAFTFGAIIPTVFISVMALIGMVIYKFIRLLMLKIITKIRNSKRSPNR
jgi:hypothetical protein